MPVGSPTTKREMTAVALALGGVVAAVLIGAAMLFLARGDGVEVRLGDETIDAGNAADIAAEIADRGPVLYADPVRGARSIYLNHLGDDPESGWHAFAVRPPGAAESCVVEWDAAAMVFVDSCSGTAFPPDGEGLTQYPVLLDGDDLVVDINRTLEREAEERQGDIVVSGESTTTR